MEVERGRMSTFYKIEGKLWQHLEKLVWEDADLNVRENYIPAIRGVCAFAAERAGTIRDTFPLYTLHNDTHINNVLRITADLLGEERLKTLPRDMTAMLILAAFCHDIGMSYSEGERADLLDDVDEVETFLDAHPEHYRNAYKNGEYVGLPEAAQREFFRSLHHERAGELLCAYNEGNWPDILIDNVPRQELIDICKRHNNDPKTLHELSSSNPYLDLPLCGVLLRLADIMDFDDSRAPQPLYDYAKFDGKKPADMYSEGEWKKHIASRGFHFKQVKDRTVPYELPFSATSKTPDVEAGIRNYLDWVEKELFACERVLKREKNNLVLPYRVDATFRNRPYESAEYHLTMDHGKVLGLLSGEDLYSDPMVFVRELIQNAIDAVRTREKLDRHLPRKWEPKIKIHTWMDAEGYSWFRIEDNGIGMTEKHIRDHLLKVGCSYYTSVEFERDKLLAEAEEDYTPISRFGIGILSCFMGDNRDNELQISTKHYAGNSPAMLLKMQGMDGYYYLTKKGEGAHTPQEMKGIDSNTKNLYRSEPGTTIALRTNLLRLRGDDNYKKIVDRYVVCPPVPIEYEDDENSFAYPTEKQFMDAVHAIAPCADPMKAGEVQLDITSLLRGEVKKRGYDWTISESTKLIIKVVAFDRYTKTPYFTGAMLAVKIEGRIEEKNGSEVHLTLVFDSTKNTIYLTNERCLPNNVVLSYAQKFNVQLFDLSTWELYSNYFGFVGGTYWGEKPWQPRNRKIVVHNGVYCGAWNVLGDLFSGTSQVLLLKDKYRPALGMARDKIRKLPLEMLCEMATVWNTLNVQNFVREVSDLIELDEPADLTQEGLRKALESRTDLEDHFFVRTDQGIFAVRNLLEKVRIYGELRIFDIEAFDFEDKGDAVNLREMNSFLLRYYIQEKFLVKAKKSSCDYEIWVAEHHSVPDKNEGAVFPPCFFLEPYYTGQEPAGRLLYEIDCNNKLKTYAINKNHRLAKFLLQNGAEIKQHAPSIFTRLLNRLLFRWSTGNRYCSAINTQLKNLKSLKINGKKNYFDIKDDLLLTEEDMQFF